MADSESSRSNKSEEGEGTGFFFLIEMAGVATIIGLRGCGAGVSVAVLEFALGATTFFAETEFGATCAAITATGSVAALFDFDFLRVGGLSLPSFKTGFLLAAERKLPCPALPPQVLTVQTRLRRMKSCGLKLYPR